MLIEAQKAWHNGHGLNTAIKANQWGTAVRNGIVTSDKLFVAQSFDAALGKSSSTFSGVSTLAANPMLQATFDGGASVESNVWYFIQYDAKFQCSGGQCTVSY